MWLSRGFFLFVWIGIRWFQGDGEGVRQWHGFRAVVGGYGVDKTVERVIYIGWQSGATFEDALSSADLFCSVTAMSGRFHRLVLKVL